MKKVKVEINININIPGGKTNPAPNPEYLQIRDEYNKLISNVVNDNLQDEEFIGGMPVQLEKGCLKQLIKQNDNSYTYYATLKVDGERYLLFLASNGVVYLIDRSVNFYYFEIENKRLMPLDPKVVKPFLIDGELVSHHDHYEYLIFDLLFYQGDSYIEKDYYTRYDVANYAINMVLKKYFRKACKRELTVSLKTWFPINLNVPNVYKHIIAETNRTRTTALKADGIILQPFNTPYVTFGPWNKYNNVQFKWKPSNQLTIDFKIKAMGPNEWHLLTKSGEPYNVNQKDSNPLPATCIPTETQKKIYFDGDVVEFRFKETGNPNKNLFIPERLRNEKEANSLSTIMSTMCVIFNPFTLDNLRPAFKFLSDGRDLAGYLNIFSESDLILCIVSNFFDKFEQKEIKKVYTRYVLTEGPVEMELRIFKGGKKGKTLDKFTYYYLLDFLKIHFKEIVKDTIDITENKSTKGTKLRSTYNSLKDINERNSTVNEYKNKIIDYKFKVSEKKLYNNLTFKLELANEIVNKKVIGLKSLFAGKMVNNNIRVKNRHSFKVNDLWTIDLTKVTSAYTLQTLKDKNETYELECEYTGDRSVPFEIFIKTMSDLYKMIMLNSNYCESCVV